VISTILTGGKIQHICKKGVTEHIDFQEVLKLIFEGTGGFAVNLKNNSKAIIRYIF